MLGDHPGAGRRGPPYWACLIVVDRHQPASTRGSPFCSTISTLPHRDHPTATAVMGTAPEESIALRPGPDDDLARTSDLSRVVCGRMRGRHAMFSVFLWSFHAATTCQCYVRRPSWRRLGRFRGFRCCGQGTSVVSRPLLRLPRVGVESAVPESAGDVKRRLGEAPSVKPSTSPAVPSPEGESLLCSVPRAAPMACIVGRAGAGKTWDKQASRKERVVVRELPRSHKKRRGMPLEAYEPRTRNTVVVKKRLKTEFLLAL